MLAGLIDGDDDDDEHCLLNPKAAQAGSTSPTASDALMTEVKVK